MTMFAVTLFSVVGSLLAVLQLSAAAPAYVVMSSPNWSYNDSSNNGPSRWYLMPGLGTCGGKNQSPINIQTDNTIKLNNNLRFYNYDRYQTESLSVRNDGHSVNVDFGYGSTTNLDYIPYISGAQLKDRYKLINIHFHWGSKSTRGAEHTFNGGKRPIEVHLVHIKRNFNDLTEAREHKDGIAVVGSMFEITTNDNPHLRTLLSSFQYVRYKDQTRNIQHFNIYDVLPNDYEYNYAYFGSLTTPPCSESVSWNVFERAAQISEAQMRIFRNLQKETQANDPNNNMPLVDNFRPVQPLNGRTVYWQPQY